MSEFIQPKFQGPRWPGTGRTSYVQYGNIEKKSSKKSAGIASHYFIAILNHFLKFGKPICFGSPTIVAQS